MENQENNMEADESVKKKPGRKPRETAVEIVADEPVPVTPAPKAAEVPKETINLLEIAASVSASFEPHEHGGVLTKGTRKVSLNMENYKSERQVRKILSAHGF